MPPYTSPLSSPSLRTITHLSGRASYFPSAAPSRALHSSKPTSASVHPLPHPPHAHPTPTPHPHAHPGSPGWRAAPGSPASPGSPAPGHGIGWDEALRQRHSPVLELPPSLNGPGGMHGRPRVMRQSSLKNPVPMYPTEPEVSLNDAEIFYTHAPYHPQPHAHYPPAQIVRPTAPVPGYAPRGAAIAPHPHPSGRVSYSPHPSSPHPPSPYTGLTHARAPYVHSPTAAPPPSILNTPTTGVQAAERRRPSFKIDLPPRPSLHSDRGQGETHHLTQAQREALALAPEAQMRGSGERENFVILRARSRSRLPGDPGAEGGEGGASKGDSALEVAASEGRVPTVGLGYTLKMRAPTPWVRKLAEDEEWLTPGDLDDIEHGMSKIHV